MAIPITNCREKPRSGAAEPSEPCRNNGYWGISAGASISSITFAGVRAQKRLAVWTEIPFMFRYRVRSREEERCPISICSRL